MKILFIGDIVGSPGRAAVKGLLPGLRKRREIDFVVANAENAAGGSGITPRVARDLFQSGCDVLTSGDHVWRRPEVVELLHAQANILRPANFPKMTPGHGSAVIKSENGAKVGVVCLLGRVFIDAMVESPFRVVQDEIKVLRQETAVIIVDVHAEATSEKVAMGWFLDGEVSAVLGTHTHIQTADETILPKGTAYITDVGMTGPYDSVIGRNKDKIIERFLTGMPTRFELGTGDVRLCGALVEVDAETGKAARIERIREPFQARNNDAQDPDDQ
ncbi:MAG: TIGR00282 family metallophosphoesterase [Candidatus Omnitrophica bacterium]|nr:TIGR00282 family metallophosphoesterase [Candidatus Omnitrophota bacterium]MDD5574052.1 TIGR00282 family metallophosphoesterase [Candidatus Omnitrophota bacterium]